MNVVFDLESVGNTELLGPPHDKYLRHASVEGFKEIEMTELEYWITLIIDSLVCLFVFAVESWTLESAESLSLAYLIITPQISQPYATSGWHLARVFLPYPAPH